MAKRFLLVLSLALICSTRCALGESKDVGSGTVAQVKAKPLHLEESDEDTLSAGQEGTDFEHSKNEEISIVESDKPTNILFEKDKYLRLLTRANDPMKKIIAIVLIKPDGTAVLNPIINTWKLKVDYGTIPKLKEMTSSICNRLWGGRSSGHGKASFDLITADNMKTRFAIDISFKDKKVVQYRIRSKELQSCEWTTVHSQN